MSAGTFWIVFSFLRGVLLHTVESETLRVTLDTKEHALNCTEEEVTSTLVWLFLQEARKNSWPLLLAQTWAIDVAAAALREALGRAGREVLHARERL